ncbi:MULTISPECIES: hypothetical protein [unclassified Enterococcus]|uniref:hypothetical protein n=1 Tax=unclassified Enterococcus TaxID=2608891 RepID=UPI0013E9ABAD|nr:MULTISPECIES: hypothetical protein [unclassified Enterococcus]
MSKKKAKKQQAWRTFREIVGSYLAVVFFLPLLYMAITEQTRVQLIDVHYLVQITVLFFFVLIYAFYKAFHSK